MNTRIDCGFDVNDLPGAGKLHLSCPVIHILDQVPPEIAGATQEKGLTAC